MAEISVAVWEAARWLEVAARPEGAMPGIFQPCLSVVSGAWWHCQSLPSPRGWRGMKCSRSVLTAGVAVGWFGSSSPFHHYSLVRATAAKTRFFLLTAAQMSQDGSRFLLQASTAVCSGSCDGWALDSHTNHSRMIPFFCSLRLQWEVPRVLLRSRAVPLNRPRWPLRGLPG